LVIFLREEEVLADLVASAEEVLVVEAPVEAGRL